MSEKLKIVYRPLQKLSPYAHNARTHSPEQVAQLVESIKQFGWTNPVLIDEKGEIIAGHGRVMAAEVLKMDSVPVIVLSGLKEDQKKAYRLADNRLPLNAGWDEELLRMELSELINADFDISLTGFSPTEIDELLMEVLPGTELRRSRTRRKLIRLFMSRQAINRISANCTTIRKLRSWSAGYVRRPLILISKNSSCVQQNVTRCLISAELRTITFTPPLKFSIFLRSRRW